MRTFAGNHSLGDVSRGEKRRQLDCEGVMSVLLVQRSMFGLL